MEARLESVWFDQSKFETAEAKFRSVLANQHRGLVVEGKGVSSQAVSLSTEIGKAMDLIGKSLNSSSLPSIPGELERRVSELEKENVALKADMKSVMERLKVLECKAGIATTEIGKKGSAPPEVGKARSAAQKSAEDEDDDFDLFGDTDDEDELNTLKEERKKQMSKKSKPKVVAKSSLILDIKPWDDETDMSAMEGKVRLIETDGLLWGASKFLPVAYGIKKLQICCVVEDDKVGTDFLEESIQDIEDYVQSVDIVAFNKI